MKHIILTISFFVASFATTQAQTKKEIALWYLKGFVNQDMQYIDKINNYSKPYALDNDPSGNGKLFEVAFDHQVDLLTEDYISVYNQKIANEIKPYVQEYYKQQMDWYKSITFNIVGEPKAEDPEFPDAYTVYFNYTAKEVNLESLPELNEKSKTKDIIQYFTKATELFKNASKIVTKEGTFDLYGSKVKGKMYFMNLSPMDVAARLD